MPDKTPSKPSWLKNTYFWFAAILAVVGLIGLFGGDGTIRDPGQRREGGLAFLYLGAAAVMLVNGFISHSQTVQHFRETNPGDTPTE